MALFKNSKHASNKMGRDMLRILIFLAFVISVLPTTLLHAGKLTKWTEIYISFVIYTVILMFFGHVIYLNIEAKLNRQMKALVKKEGIISGELLMINTEEKLKNVLSLEFERCFMLGTVSSILFYDVDELGEINRKYGYNTGDQVIIEVIQTSKDFIQSSKVLGNTGAIIARVKGDTFALLMPGISENVAYSEAERLKHVLEALDFGIEESITCRFAVLSMDQWVSEDKFLDLAYEKLILAKDYGRGVIL
ncbi:MAG: GGDEF domain-containing protein [Firmicutes bacterium]|nr:GGDEF domain-containing protein [Bacillota bacterium]